MHTPFPASPGGSSLYHVPPCHGAVSICIILRVRPRLCLLYCIVTRHICPVVPEMHARPQGVCQFLATCRVLQQVDPDKAFAVQIAHEENVVSSPVAYLQCALLYTSSSGERRIRQVALQCTTVALHRCATFIPSAQFCCPGYNCIEILGASKSWWGVSRGLCMWLRMWGWKKRIDWRDPPSIGNPTTERFPFRRKRNCNCHVIF